MALPELDGEGIGFAVMPFLHTGAKWIATRGDDEGHPQVDVLTIPYPGLAGLERASVTGPVASSSAWTTVGTDTGPGILEAIDFSTTYFESQLRVTIDGQDLGLCGRTGWLSGVVSPLDLSRIDGESALYKGGIYDDTNDYYSLFLKRAIHYKTSLVVRVRQESGADKNIACQVLYRLL